jgi:endonuclease-3
MDYEGQKRNSMDQKKAIRQFNAIKKYSDRTSMRLAAEEWDSEWKIIVSILMSAQTRDETTIVVAEELFKKYPTVEKLANAKLSDVEESIRKVNYYRNKAKNIIGCAKKISEEGIQHDLDWLVTLPGVGRKTANVFLSEVIDSPSIGVDTHVYRISRRLGWATGNTPDKVEQDLMNLFPKRYWTHINSVLVRFGKGYGTSKKKEEEILEEIIAKTQ